MTKISLIITVKNEAKTLEPLLQSIVDQTRMPDEVVLVDGNSVDATVKIINDFVANLPKKSNIVWQISSQESNISKGRNRAITVARNELIAITDAGCVLEKNWLEELEKCYIKNSKKAETKKIVVAGYYKGVPRTPFEEAVVPYVLVMPDHVNEQTFLPATRSMLLPKKMWEELGGFNEKLAVSEDYAFAHQIIKRYGIHAIVFCRKAIVGWRPRSNFRDFFTMIFKMAEGDIRAGIYRGKVKLLFGRYIGAILILLVSLKAQSLAGILFLFFGMCLYVAWAIHKNIKYVANGWYYLPILQILADIAVMFGSISAIWYL